MKKVLIVNNNLSVGGIQKSLVNLLKSYRNHDITLMLFSSNGVYEEEVPSNVRVIYAKKRYITLGLNKEELKKHPFYYVVKAIMMLLSRCFSQRVALKILGIGQKKVSGFDVAISYSPLFHNKSFTNGVGVFTIDKVNASTKICFIHNDYKHSGTMTKENNLLYSLFDKIVCCSESVKKVFVNENPQLEKKTFVLRNFLDYGVSRLAEANRISFDELFINIIMVARLSPEKNHTGVIDALAKSNRTDIRLYLIGDGPTKDEIQKKIVDLGLEKQVMLCGETNNPYGYMKDADYLVVSSFHEAAPIVFDEAHILGLPIISSRTTSANEMLYPGQDTIYESQDELLELLVRLKKKTTTNNCFMEQDNNESRKQTLDLIIG